MIFINKNIMRFRLSYFILFLAIATATCAAYFSVWGLSQLFAGASISIMIMAIILEIGKLGATTALHRNWNNIGKTLRAYLTTVVIVLMLITSAGIYGFLSNAYQSTANKLDIQKGYTGILDNKKLIFEKNINNNQAIIDTKNKRIEQLSNLRSSQETRLDSARTVSAKDKVRGDIQKATDEIQKLSSEVDILNQKNSSLSDSVNTYNIASLELTSNSDVSAEIGPLKYIAELTGYPMSKVVNVLILMFIFVFDPFAVALVLMANKLFDLETSKEHVSQIKTFIPEGVSESVSEDVNDPVSESVSESVNDPVSESVSEDVNDPVSESVSEDVNDPVNESVNESVITKREPVIPTGKIELKDIKEIKDRVKKTNNTIERVGSNKIIKDGDNNKIFFKRDK